jgi:hypothetical protein
MRAEDSTSSAVPDKLFAYRDGLRDIDIAFRAGPLARVRATISALRARL